MFIISCPKDQSHQCQMTELKGKVCGTKVGDKNKREENNATKHIDNLSVTKKCQSVNTTAIGET